MDYPQKHVFIENGVVVGFVVIYGPESTVGAPPPGQIVRIVEGDRPYTIGWKHYIDDEGNEFWVEPVANTINAGNGKPPPKNVE